MLLVAAIGLAVVSVVAQQDQLKIDPMMLVSLRECRSIVSSIGAQFYPGWKWEQTPILFYRPGVQDVLINYPHLPSGFHEFTGINPLGKEKIYVRDTDTLMKVDGQNTSAELEGIKVLVVADTFSRQRGDIRGEMRRDPEHQQSWLNDWSFIQSPYDDIRFMLHEGFHVYQGTRSPDKFADERRIADFRCWTLRIMLCTHSRAQ